MRKLEALRRAALAVPGVVFAGVFAILGRGQAFRPAKFAQIALEGVVYAIFVLPVPPQLSLESGLEHEEAQGRSVLESARIQARRAGIKIHTGLIRTRHPGAALVEEAQRVGADVIYWSAIHAPAGEQQIGPTAAYLLSKRPCRVIIETDNRRSPARRPRAEIALGATPIAR